MKKQSLIEVLVEDVDEDILNKITEWFRVLRDAYQNRDI